MKADQLMEEIGSAVERHAPQPDTNLMRVSKALVNQCVRNTGLEDLHGGITPDSKTGDFSDVKVVTPYGEIPWTELSRISDEEMKPLMKEIVNKVYTYLYLMLKENMTPGGMFCEPQGWDDPELDTDFYGLMMLVKERTMKDRKKNIERHDDGQYLLASVARYFGVTYKTVKDKCSNYACKDVCVVTPDPARITAEGLARLEEQYWFRRDTLGV